jgi:hypothetical protein
MLVLAHGVIPLATQLVETPGTPTHLVAATNVGLMLSDDDGAEWKWVCEEAAGYGQNLPASWWVSSQGVLFVANLKGLLTSTDHGCSWAEVADFAPLPDGGQGPGTAELYGDATALFAVSAKYGVVNGVWRSADEGARWERLSLRSDVQFYTSVRTAPSRPQRVYVGAWWLGAAATEALYVSESSGDAFTRIDVTEKMPRTVLADGGSAPARGSFYVRAVHPLDPDTVWAELRQGDPIISFLLRSTDQGQSWQLMRQGAGVVESLVLSDDGQTVWITAGGTLYRSTNGGADLAPLDAPARSACASRFGPRLYACGSPGLDPFAIGRSVDGGGFEPVLTWSRVTGVADCPATSLVTTECAGFFPSLQATFFGPDAGPDVTPQIMAHCGCGAGEGTACALAVWVLWRGLRRRPHAARR